MSLKPEKLPRHWFYSKTTIRRIRQMAKRAVRRVRRQAERHDPENAPTRVFKGWAD